MLIGFSAFIAREACAQAQVPFEFTAKKGHAYHIQINTALDNRFWQDVQVVSNATGRVNLSLPTTNGPVGFYRYCDTTNSVFWYGWSWYEQNPNLKTWGMGTSQKGYAHNDQPWDWYIDQGNTGPDSDVNCGPASTAMACKWWDQNTSVTAEGARETYPEGDGWWYTTDVVNYLSLQGITNGYFPVDQQTFTNLLAQGNILILCLDMSYITQATNAVERVHAFYSGVTGHFIVAKGYRITSSDLWVECYDPFDLGAAYTDGTPKGRDRHYGWNELSAAMTNWWPDCIAVSPPPAGNISMAQQQTAGLSKRLVGSLDPATVPVARGQ
jgi:hypothetical protein